MKESVAKFIKMDVLTRSAALAFYMIFSWPAALLVILWTAARFYKEVAVREAIFLEIGDLVGKEGAHQLIATVEKINIQAPNWWSTTVGIGLLLFTATTVLVTIKSALNCLFEIEAPDTEGLGIWEMFHQRVTSFTLLVTISFILLVSQVVETLVTAIGKFVANWIGGFSTYIMVFDLIVLDLGATTMLFAMFFRYLPDVKLKWKDIWFGALLTTVLLAVGKYMIGFIIGNNEVANLYDAAGSVLVLMLWVYYVSAIFLFGAAMMFTRAKLLKNGLATKCCS